MQLSGIKEAKIYGQWCGLTTGMVYTVVGVANKRSKTRTPVVVYRASADAELYTLPVGEFLERFEPAKQL